MRITVTKYQGIETTSTATYQIPLDDMAERLAGLLTEGSEKELIGRFNDLPLDQQLELLTTDEDTRTNVAALADSLIPGQLADYKYRRTSGSGKDMDIFTSTYLFEVGEIGLYFEAFLATDTLILTPRVSTKDDKYIDRTAELDRDGYRENLLGIDPMQGDVKLCPAPGTYNSKKPTTPENNNSGLHINPPIKEDNEMLTAFRQYMKK